MVNDYDPDVPAEDDARPCLTDHTALEQAISDLKQCIKGQEDLADALQTTSYAIALMRSSVTDFTQMRAEIAAHMSTGHTSLTRLATLLGVSKSRAGQIVEAGKRLLLRRG